MLQNERPSHLKKAHQLLLKIEDTILVIMLLAMISLAVFQIVLRNVFDSGIVWTDQLVRVLVLWIGLFGAMTASREGKHINIDLVTRYLTSDMKRTVAQLIVNLFTASVCGVMSYYSIQFVKMEYEFGAKAFAQVPSWICESIIPFAFVVITVRYVVLSWIQFRKLISPAP